MTTYGWDASHYDWGRGPMNIAAARSAGIQFFTHKATEGTSYVDAQFVTAMSRARAAGMPLLGAYHVLHTASINAQVDHFLATLPSWLDGEVILAQLDVEHWADDSPPPSAVYAWCDRFTVLTGRRPVVYASRGQYGNTLGGLAARGVPLWNAAYPTGTARSLGAAYTAAGGDQSANWAAYSGAVPAIWQYSSNATIGGQPGCDVNAFRGTLADLQALIGGDDMALTDTEHSWLAATTNRTNAVVSDDNPALPGYPSPTSPLGQMLAAAKRINAGALGGGLTDEQIATQAKAIGDALIASGANGLTAVDHAGVVADVVAALNTLHAG